MQDQILYFNTEIYYDGPRKDMDSVCSNSPNSYAVWNRLFLPVLLQPMYVLEIVLLSSMFIRVAFIIN